MAINAWKPSARDLPNENEIKTETQLPEVEKVHLQNSVEEGRKAFQWLINPIKPDVFLKENWESNACQVRRKSPDYYSHLISFAMIDEMLLTNHVEFTTNIDITSYVNGERSTLNPEGRAMPPTIWDHYADGCSIRIINPSTFLPSVQVLCTVMQEYFHCLVGANVYLTPPNSQGFAPHYDDIEAFVLQVEGRKRWRLYSPLHKSDALARVSSGNYKQQELGKPIFDVVLEAGDLLYFPRGTVHQAVTEQDYHSLHITLSVYQKQAYADLLEHVLPKTLERSIKHHSVLRRGLPLNIWGNLGMIHKLNPSTERAELLSEVKTLIMNHIMPTDEQIDAAVDQMALRFQREALPPIVDPEEKVRTIFGSRSQTDASGRCLCDYEFTGRTEVRLLRANIVRVVNEGKKKRVYYYVDNGLEYCKYEPNFIEISSSEVCVIQTLIDAYPSYTRIDTLPMESIERCIESATALWERGLLMTKKPFKAD